MDIDRKSLIPVKVQLTENDSFEYGIIIYKHRFSVNRSLDDYEETVIMKGIRMGVHHLYKTMAKDKLVTEMQILYKDENNKVQCLRKDLEDWTFEIVHKGDMSICL